MDFTSTSWAYTSYTADISSDGQYDFTGDAYVYDGNTATVGNGWDFVTATWNADGQYFVLPIYMSAASWAWTAQSFADKRTVLSWSLSVSVGGENVTARLTDTLTITAEESTSRLAEFSLKPTGALIAVGDLTGQAVTIDFIEDPDGAATTTRLFTGEVNEVNYDVSTRVMRVDCFDNLQAFFRGKTEAQILALIPGYYSEHVFGEREDGWVQAQDVLSTVCGSYDKDRNGNGVFTFWNAGGIKYWFDESYIRDGSIAVEIGREKDRVHQVDVTFDYRFTRKHQRRERMAWDWGQSWCDWIGYNDYALSDWELPDRSMFQEAITGTSWNLSDTGISFTGLPATGVYRCGFATVVWERDDYGEELVTAANWTWVKNWCQTITETYTISVGTGANVYEDSAGFETEFDDNSWEDSGDVSVPAWSINTAGDYYEDVTDRVALENALLTITNKAYRTVMESHRNNYLLIETGIIPAIERSDFVSIDYPGIASANGKVFEYVHTLDVNGGTAMTRVKIATNSGGGGSVTVATAAPSIDPSIVYTGSPDLRTYIGNDGDADPYDETWTGVITNYESARNLPVAEDQVYPKQVRVETMEIDTTSRDEATGTATDSVTVPTGTDSLVIGV